MDTTPNVVLRGGPADGQTSHVPEPGERISVEDVGGGSITYVDTQQTEEHDGVRLRVYELRH